LLPCARRERMRQRPGRSGPEKARSKSLFTHDFGPMALFFEPRFRAEGRPLLIDVDEVSVAAVSSPRGGRPFPTRNTTRHLDVPHHRRREIEPNSSLNHDFGPMASIGSRKLVRATDRGSLRRPCLASRTEPTFQKELAADGFVFPFRPRGSGSWSRDAAGSRLAGFQPRCSDRRGDRLVKPSSKRPLGLRRATGLKTLKLKPWPPIWQKGWIFTIDPVS